MGQRWQASARGPEYTQEWVALYFTCAYGRLKNATARVVRAVIFQIVDCSGVRIEHCRPAAWFRKRIQSTFAGKGQTPQAALSFDVCQLNHKRS